MAWNFPFFGKYWATPPTLTDGDKSAPALDVNSTLKVSLSSPAVGQATKSGSIPVTMASDQDSLDVTVSNFPATQPVSLTSLPTLAAGTALIGKVGIDQTTDGTTNKVSVGNFPATQAVTQSGAWTVTVSAPLAVTGTFFQATQPVSLTSLPALATGSNVIGGVTQSGTWNVGISTVGQTTMAASVPVTIASNQSAIPVTGTFFQATQPVSLTSLPALAAGANAIGTVGVTSLPALPAGANAIGSVSVSNFPATQPVSGTVAVSNFPATQAVTGTFWQATQPVSVAALPALATGANTIGAVTQAGSWNVGLSAGANVVGQVGIDQTTNGTTNRVYVGNTLPSPIETQDMRNQLRTSQKQVVIHQNCKLPLSTLRQLATVANGGTVTQVSSEYVVATTTTTTSSAIHETLKRGAYTCGLTACVDISGRCPVTPTGAGEVTWGYMDANDGYGFGKDATGTFIFIRKAGVTEKTYQAAWNGDRLNGTGASGLTLNVQNGNIYNIEFNWFGYGTAEFAVFLPTGPNNRASRIIVHTDRPAQASQRTNSAVLPLRIEVQNNGAATALSFAYGGMSFSLLGDHRPEIRFQAATRTGATFGNNTTQIHIMSIRHKATTNFEAVRVMLDSIKAISTAASVLEVRIGCTLTGAVFAAPPNQSATETAIEVDITSTAFSGGTVIYGTGISSGTTADNAIDLADIEIPAGSTITFVARLQTAAAGQSFNLFPTVKEEW